MFKLRLLMVGPAAALVIAAAGSAASVGAMTSAISDSHGDTVASAARTTCPHGPGDAHGKCVSAIAKSKPDSTCKAADQTEDAAEKAADRTEDAAERAVRTGNHAGKAKDKTEKALERTEDQAEKAADRAEDLTEKTSPKSCAVNA